MSPAFSSNASDSLESARHAPDHVLQVRFLLDRVIHRQQIALCENVRFQPRDGSDPARRNDQSSAISHGFFSSPIAAADHPCHIGTERITVDMFERRFHRMLVPPDSAPPPVRPQVIVLVSKDKMTATVPMATSGSRRWVSGRRTAAPASDPTHLTRMRRIVRPMQRSAEPEIHRSRPTMGLWWCRPENCGADRKKAFAGCPRRTLVCRHQPAPARRLRGCLRSRVSLSVLLLCCFCYSFAGGFLIDRLHARALICHGTGAASHQDRSTPAPTAFCPLPAAMAAEYIV